MEQLDVFTDLDEFMSKSDLPTVPVDNIEDDPSYGFEYNNFEGDDPQQNYQQPSTDFVTNVLKRHGIDVNDIQITNEEGEVESVKFSDLTEDEKMELYDMITESSITDEEINTLNILRNNKMSLSDMIKWQREEAIKEYLAQSQQPQYSVDQLSDDDLYMYELHDRYPDITDEEMAQELEYAKQNEALFAKKISALRSEYKELENEKIKAQQQQAEQEREQEFEQLSRSLVDVARNTNELHDLIIEDEDKEAVLSFLLDRDANGQSQFYKLFEDPQKLFELAWYAKFGKQAFLDVNDYYKKVIEQTRRGSATPAQKVARRSADIRRSPADKFDLDGQYANI